MRWRRSLSPRFFLSRPNLCLHFDTFSCPVYSLHTYSVRTEMLVRSPPAHRLCVFISHFICESHQEPDLSGQRSAPKPMGCKSYERARVSNQAKCHHYVIPVLHASNFPFSVQSPIAAASMRCASEVSLVTRVNHMHNAHAPLK